MTETARTIQRLITPSFDVALQRRVISRGRLAVSQRGILYSDTFIEVQDVQFSYSLPNRQSIPALAGVSLTLRPGEYLAVLGRNGSGKSTLARLLNGLLVPTSGRVLVDGLNTADAANSRDIRRRVGLVFQTPDNQLIANTVEEDVAFGPENLGVPREELPNRVRRALEMVGMWEHRLRPPHMLSAGQKQRVAVAGVLAMNPSCLVLDEATAMLDPAGRRAVLDIAKGLNCGGTAIVAITHDVGEALQATRVAILENGRLLEVGSPRAVLTEEARLHAAGLEAPPVVRLVHELRRRGVPAPADALSVEELAQSLALLREGAGR